MTGKKKSTVSAIRLPDNGSRPGTGRERVFLALGSNVGRRPANLRQAFELIRGEPKINVVGVSRLYSTAPVGYTAQRNFLNGVLELRTRLGPRDLIDRLQRIEVRMGKNTPFRNGPRRIDIDLVLYGQRRILEGGLIVPHPRMHCRRFVLEPLAELAARAMHPGLRRTVAHILAGLGTGESVRPWGAWVSDGR